MAISVKGYYDTIFPEIQAYIIVSADKEIVCDGKIINNKISKKAHFKISGYLVYKDSGIPVDHGKSHSISNIKGIKILNLSIHYLIGRLVCSYIKNTDKDLPSAGQSKTPYTDAFNSIKDKSIFYATEGWRPSTIKNYISYFRCSVLPQMDPFGINITQSNMDKIQADLIERATENGDKIEAKAEKGVRTKLAHANDFLQIIYSTMIGLPVNRPFFDLPPRSRVSSTEQLKALPARLRITLAFILWLLPVETYPLLLGVALMFYSGLRTGEAAAPVFGDIKVHNINGKKFGTYFVAFQHNGAALVPPKSPNAYRHSILPRALMHKILERREYLEDQGYSSAVIDKMPIVAHPDDPTRFAGPNAISAFAKVLLEKSGFSVTDDLIAMMIDEPLYDADDLPIMEPHAYMLRRDWCSRMFSICGIDGDIIDYLIGHKSDYRRDTSHSMNEDRLIEVAEMCERFVAVPEKSYHPLFDPIMVKDTFENVDIPAHCALSIQAAPSLNHAVKIHLTLSCTEPLDCIEIQSPQDVTIHHNYKGEFKPEAFRIRTIIAPPYDDALYTECRLAAQTIISEGLYNDTKSID